MMTGMVSLIYEPTSKCTQSLVYGAIADDGPPAGYLFKASRPNLTADGFVIDDDTIVTDEIILVAYQLPSSGGKNYAGLVDLLDNTIWYTSGSPNSLQLSTITADILTNTSMVIAGNGGKVVIYPTGTNATKINKAKKWAGVPV